MAASKIQNPAAAAADFEFGITELIISRKIQISAAAAADFEFWH